METNHTPHAKQQNSGLQRSIFFTMLVLDSQHKPVEENLESVYQESCFSYYLSFLDGYYLIIACSSNK
jgi:hypothetical protein